MLLWTTCYFLYILEQISGKNYRELEIRARMYKNKYKEMIKRDSN